jgi:CRP/FNR family transcriptional regulator, cyclic AMP receptor protein
LQLEFFKPSSKFARASDEAKKALTAAFSRRAYANNEVIYLQEEPATYLYFILSGHVRLSYVMDDGSAILYAILPTGDSFGELGVFDGGTHCDMAMGIGNTVVGSVSIQKFDALCQLFPELQRCIGLMVASRYRSYIELARMMSLKTLQGRIAQMLLRLADDLSTKVQYNGVDIACVGPVVTQADLGLMARGARGSVNRTLKNWEREGWLVMKDRAILITNRAALEACALEEDI